MLRLFSAFFLLTISHLTSANGFSFFDKPAGPLPVNEAFAFDFQQMDNQLLIQFNISDGYYLYRDKLEYRSDSIEFGKINYPDAQNHHDEFFGDQAVYYGETIIAIPLKNAKAGDELNITFMGCAEGLLCYPPTQVTAVVSSDVTRVDAEDTVFDSASMANTVSGDTPKDASLVERLSDGSVLITLVLFFGLGLGLSLTPCVFPMYPILASIIVGQGKALSPRKGLLLGLSYVNGMAITYSLLGLVVAMAGLQYQAALQHPVLLALLALLFIVLSLPMFGLFELQLPAKWQNTLNRLSEKQGAGKYASVFSMGALSGLIASPCTTAPLSGALLYVAQTGDVTLGFFALYVLSLGMGIPLLIIATSGGKWLPKAGMWMNTVKHIFGFLLLSVAILFIERFVTHWMTELLWAALGVGFAGFLLFVAKGLSEVKTVVVQTLAISLISASVLHAYHYSPLNAPIEASHDKQQHFIDVKGLSGLQAQLGDKPAMLDLYAIWCVACKEFEEQTFPASEVKVQFEQFKLLRADVSAADAIDNELLEHYSVLGLPTILFFNKNGEVMPEFTVTGFMDAKAFAKHLERVLQSQ